MPEEAWQWLESLGEAWDTDTRGLNLQVVVVIIQVQLGSFALLGSFSWKVFTIPAQHDELMRRGLPGVSFKAKRMCTAINDSEGLLCVLSTACGQLSQWRHLRIPCPSPPLLDCSHNSSKHWYSLSLAAIAICSCFPLLSLPEFVLLVSWASASCVSTSTTWFLTGQILTQVTRTGP